MSYFPHSKRPSPAGVSASCGGCGHLRWRHTLRRLGPLLFAAAPLLTACDHGLAPPEDPQYGAIEAHIVYEGGPSAWPPPTAVVDLRFVAMRFVPRDTSDLFQLDRIAFSSKLEYGVAEERVLLDFVEPGTFVYSGVAQRYGSEVLAWRPVGLVQDAEGVFDVEPSETTRVFVNVDFSNPPPFPPEIAR